MAPVRFLEDDTTVRAGGGIETEIDCHTFGATGLTVT